MEKQCFLFNNLRGRNYLLTTKHDNIEKFGKWDYYNGLKLGSCEINIGCCNELLSTFFFDKFVIDGKSKWTLGKLTSYHVQHLFDWEFAMESVKYGGTIMLSVDDVLAYNDLTYVGSLGNLGRTDQKTIDLLNEEKFLIQKLYG